MREAKVILLGSSGVGKTSLVQAKITNNFESTLPPTVASSCFRTMVQTKNDEDVELLIWDTAGQEQYQSLIKPYIRDTTVAIIVVSVNQQKSIQDLMTWVKLLYEHCPNAGYVVALNKCDLVEDSAPITDQIQQEVGDEIQVVPTSALTGEFVQELFVVAGTLAIKLLNQQADAVNTALVEKAQEPNGCKC